MTKQYIDVMQTFNAPVDRVFEVLTDHGQLGKLLKVNMRRIVDGECGYVNGLGSVRKITPVPFLGFEEKVITFEPNQLMEYIVSKGSPIKNHKGRMEFSETTEGTRVRYTIEFEPKLPVPFLGGLLKAAIETPIIKGLSSLAASYR